MPEQKINHLKIPGLEILDNTEQKKGGKFISILCSAKGGDFSRETGAARLYPSGKYLTVRSVERVKDEQVVAVLKGIHRSDLRRGNVIVPITYAVDTGKDAFFLIPSSKDRLEKGNYFIEGGIYEGYNSRNSKPCASISFHGRLASVRFFYPFPLVPGARYHISREDDRNLQIPVTLVFTGSLNNKDSQILAERILKFGGRPSLKAIYSIILRMNKAVNMPVFMEDEEFEGSVRSGSWAIMSREYDRMSKAILKRSASFGGVPEKDLLPKIQGDEKVLNQILHELISKKSILKKEGYYINIERNASESLSPIASKLLADLDQEEEGINLTNISNPLYSNTYKALARLDLVLLLDKEILLSIKRFEDLKSQLFSSLNPGDSLDLNQIKESMSLGRRLLIPFLEELDNQGYFERNEDIRTVVKTI